MGICPGTGWEAEYKGSISLPVVVWHGDDDGVFGYVVDDKSGALRRATSYSNFLGYREIEEEYTGIPEDAWLEVELVTGRRFTGRREPDGDGYAPRLLCFGLQGEKSSVLVWPESVASVTVSWEEAAEQPVAIQRG